MEVRRESEVASLRFSYFSCLVGGKVRVTWSENREKYREVYTTLSSMAQERSCAERLAHASPCPSCFSATTCKWGRLPLANAILAESCRSCLLPCPTSVFRGKGLVVRMHNVPSHVRHIAIARRWTR